MKFVESEAYTRGPRDIPFNADVAFELDKVMSSILNADLNKLEVSWQDRLVFLNCTFILRNQLGVTHERGNRRVVLREVKHLLSSHQLDISLENLPQALFSSWCGMLPFDVFQTAARQLKRLPLGERAYDDLLAKAVFLLDHGEGYYLIIPLVTALNETLPGLLKRYSDTGNFSCLFTVLQCCGHLIRECKMEIAEMFMLQAIKLWLPRHNQEGQWGDVLDVCASVRSLGDYWADSLCLEKAHWWWELAFLLHMEVMQAVKTITKPLRLCADSLRMCALFVHRPTSRNLFCKWFQRGVGLLQSVVEAGITLPIFESVCALIFFLCALKYLNGLQHSGLSEIKRLVKESALCLFQDCWTRAWKYQFFVANYEKIKIFAISAFLQSKSQDAAKQWTSFFKKIFNNKIGWKVLRDIDKMTLTYQLIPDSWRPLLSTLPTVLCGVLSKQLTATDLSNPCIVETLSARYELSSEVNAEYMSHLATEFNKATDEKEEAAVFEKLVRLLSKNPDKQPLQL